MAPDTHDGVSLELETLGPVPGTPVVRSGRGAWILDRLTGPFMERYGTIMFIVA